MKVFIRFPFDTLHKPIVLSRDVDAKYVPSGEKATLQTGSEWPLRVFMHSPILHILIVESKDPDAKFSPFGEKTTFEIGAVWPLKVLFTLHLKLFIY